MSRSPTALVQEWIEAFNARDLDRVNALYAEGCEYVIAARGLRLTGREAQRGLIERFLAAVPDRRMTVRRVTTAGGIAVVEADYDGTVSEQGLPGMPAPGERYHRELCCVLEIAGGLIQRERDYAD